MRTIIALFAVVLIFASCTKKDAPAPGYKPLQSGIVNVQETFLIEAPDTIVFSIPNGTEGQSVSILVGGAQLLSRTTATGAQSAIYIVEEGITYGRFTGTNASKVDVVLKP